MTSDTSNLQRSARYRHLLIIARQSPPEAFIALTRVLFEDVAISKIAVTELLSSAQNQAQVKLQLQQASHLIIDSQCLPDTSEQEKLTVMLHCPVLFVDFGSQQPIDDTSHSFCSLQWPCDLAGLNNKLDLSTYKHAFRQQNQQQQQKKQQHQQWLQSAISCVGNIQIYLDAQGDTLDCNDAAEQLFTADRSQLIGKPWYYLLRAKRDLSAKQTQHFIAAAIKTKAVTKIQPLAVQTLKQDNLLLDGLIGPIEYPNGQHGAVLILRKLASLDDFPIAVATRQHLPPQRENKLASSILLLTPDNFKQINHQQGWEQGDVILDEIESRIRQVLRTSDLSVRYSGASFLVLLHDTETAQTHNLLNQLMNTLGQQSYLSQEIALTFSFGLALNNEHVGYSPIELFYFANFSLSQAIEFGGNQCRQWQQQNTLQQIGNFDRVNGNSLGKGTADYQKMLTFWIILNNLGKFDSKLQFVKVLLGQLVEEFELDNCAFFELQDNQLALACAIGHDDQPLTTSEVALSKHQKMYVEQVATASGEVTVFTSILAEQGILVLVPIRIRTTLVGLIRIASSDEHAIALRDHNLLNKIADFVAVTIDNLAHEAKGQPAQLSARNLSHNANFWYASEKMQRLIEEVEMVAPTDATVLITGESGTGKEMLAKTLHESSKRSNRPFVIFDCGTVVESLLESELFGHTKGAFTGADKAAAGCIEKAEGGTLFLDEVGELPIHVQVKLLRFVQEKQFSPVGSAQYRSADVRLVAATNVDLEEQMKKGLFREDLYYRLNVFKIDSPPLRERHSDTILLAERYLAKYSEEYGKQIFGLTAEAKQAVTEYHWPGNVRELKNLIHRASILCSESMMGCTHLGLYPSSNAPNPATASGYLPSPSPGGFENPTPLVVTPAVVTPATAVIPAPVPEGEPTTRQYLPADNPVDNHIDRIAGALKVTDPMAANMPTATGHQSLPDTHSAPYSRQLWCSLINDFNALEVSATEQPLSLKAMVEKQLYQLSLDASQQITLQAASKLNIAESTFRRRWKILNTDMAGLDMPLNNKITQLATRILAAATLESKITLMQQELAHSCVSLGLSSKEAAKLLDMTPPTYRNLIRQLF